MNFRKWALEKEVLEYYMEIFDKDTFMNQEPENAKWEENGSSYRFYYSLPSDPQKICAGDPCYSVGFEDGNISFRHEDSRYADRWEKNLEIGKGDESIAKKISSEQINSILYAIGQYVTKVNPANLYWNPIAKSRSGAKNTEARTKVYFLWAAKNIYPKYVPITKSNWMRLDNFIQNYKDYDGIPKESEIEKMPIKQFVAIMESLHAKIKQEREEDNRRREAEREEQNRREAEEWLSNPNKNPQGLAVGDIVINKEDNSSLPDEERRQGRLYKITNVNTNWEDWGGSISALIVPHHEEEEEQGQFAHQTSEERWVNIKKLHKASEENRNTRNTLTQAAIERRREAEALIAQSYTDPALNPNGIQVGELVFIKNSSSLRFGNLGKVLSIHADTFNDYHYDQNADRNRYGHYGLYAKVLPQNDDNGNPSGVTSPRDFALKNLAKASPENRRIRNYNFERDPGTDRIHMPPTNWQPGQAVQQPEPELDF